MVYPLMNQTLPTIVGMGVVSRATDTMFRRRGGSINRAKRYPAPKSGMLYLATKSTKREADKFVRRYKLSHPRGKLRVTQFKFRGAGAVHVAYNVWLRR